MLEIGEKIKRRRVSLGLTQEELAARVELSKGFISQVERDLTSPSIATLTDILSALGSNLAEFFREEKDEKVVFTKEEFIEKDSDGVLFRWLIPNAQKNMMEPILVELSPRRTTEKDVPHEGEEFGYVLAGSITIWLGNKKYRCNKGESFYFVSSKTHYIENPRDTTAKFLWVSCPPNF